MLVYIARSPSNKLYVGITNNFKRRLKEHLSSPYPFGKALRKYGKEAFTFEFISNLTLDEAYEIEELLIGAEEVSSSKYYNISLGGRPDIQMGLANPMKNPEVVKRHPNIWTSENNPMNDPKIRALCSDKQTKKAVSVCGVIYKGMNIAARELGCSRQKLRHRVLSDNYPDYFFI